MKYPKVDRYLLDHILGMTGTSLEHENEICMRLFEKQSVKGLTEKEFRIVQKIMYYILEREMRVIELTGKYMNEETKRLNKK